MTLTSHTFFSADIGGERTGSGETTLEVNASEGVSE